MTRVLREGTDTRRRLSIPGPGSTVSAATEARAAWVRKAVSILHATLVTQKKINEGWAFLLGPRWSFATLVDGCEPALSAAWGLVSIRLIGRLSGILRGSASLRDAESWFTRGDFLSVSGLINDIVDRRVVYALERINHDDDLRDLLPYVLEPHGPGSRASVLRDPGTSVARLAKRTRGVFYTPADVAEYIVREAARLHGGKSDELRYFDPACGSGVFLKAALNHTCGEDNGAPDCFAFAESCLFGVEKDALAAQAACFILLSECLRFKPERELTPWAMWHRLRCNIIVADALTLEGKDGNSIATSCRSALREAIAHLDAPPVCGIPPARTRGSLFAKSYSLGEVLPELAGGTDVVVGNPPYASLGQRNDWAGLEQRYKSFVNVGNSRSLDCFPLFVEMMWRLAKSGHSSAGMVLPLSLSYHSGSQMRACRRMIESSGGCWRFAFFDREPHALFGEDVKTRNSIVFRSENSAYPPRGTCAVIETGPLRKWTSRNCALLFDSIEFTRLEHACITNGIPKLSGSDDAHVIALLKRRQDRLRLLCRYVGGRFPVEACQPQDIPSVFVAGTAYNFLNIFRPHIKLPAACAPWSNSRLHYLGFADEQRARQGFAILSSRLIYWLWHVLGDGFHVSRKFVETVPFGSNSFREEDGVLLADLGAKLWYALQDHQIVSVNGGRQTVSYRPHACEPLRDEIDAVLLRAAGIEESFLLRLRDLTRAVVAVDENDERRRQFVEQFNG